MTAGPEFARANRSNLRRTPQAGWNDRDIWHYPQAAASKTARFGLSLPSALTGTFVETGYFSRSVYFPQPDVRFLLASPAHNGWR